MVTTKNIQFKFSEFQQMRLGHEQTVTTNFSNKMRVSVSVRTTFCTTMIVICNEEDIFKHSCYWIIINVRNKTQSVIQKCEKGFLEFKEYYKKVSKCYDLLSYKVNK